MKLLYACLSVRSDLESCFLPLSSFCEARGGKFLPLWRSSEACSCQFQCGKGFTKQFSPLWKSCEAIVCQFECQERLRKLLSFLLLSRFCEASPDKFLSLSSSCEACTCQFECRKEFRKESSQIMRS